MSEKISFLNEIKTILKEYVNETEAAFKKRPKRLFVISILAVF